VIFDVSRLYPFYSGVYKYYCQFSHVLPLRRTIGLRLIWAHLLMGTMANFGQKNGLKEDTE